MLTRSSIRQVSTNGAGSPPSDPSWPVDHQPGL